MRSYVILSLLALPLLTLGAPADTRSSTAAPGRATPTVTPSPAPGGSATPAPTTGGSATPLASATPAAVPTSGSQAATGSAAPPWTGLPVRTYASLKNRIPGDPVTIAFEGTQRSIVTTFVKIGWVRADPLSVRDDVRLAEATIKHGSYPTAPVSNLYLFGRREDFAVEHELRSVYSRDHARFWDTTRRDAKTGLDLFIGDASRDIAIKVLRTSKGLPKGTTHKIDGNLDQERTTIVNLMRQAGLVTAVVMEPGMGRTTNAENGGGDRFYTDGRVAVVVLNNG